MLISWYELAMVAFCLTSIIQLFYYLWFFRRLAFYNDEDLDRKTQQPVSVVICARDEAGNLARNLPGILIQDFSVQHQVVLVNDNSQDESKYFLEGLQEQFPQLHNVELVQEAKLIPGKKFPLSMGIKAAKYDILLLTDADCVPATEFWMQRMQAPFKNNIEIVLGYGAYHKKPGLLNKIIRFDTFHAALQYLSYAIAHTPYMGVGRNLAYKRELFFRHKGFSSHNHIPGGDDDLFINMASNPDNTAIMIDQESFTLSAPETRFKRWYRQKTRHFSTARYYKPIHKFLLSLYAGTQFLYYPLLILALFSGRWELVLAFFGTRLLVQSIVFYKSMKKLNESDLFPWFMLFDIGMFFYYLLFLPSTIRKPKVTWR